MEDSEEYAFDTQHTILRDFVLLAYADTRKHLKQDYVGTSKNKRVLKIAAYNEATSTFDEAQHDLGEEIVLVVPGDFTHSGRLTFVVCLKDGSNFTALHCDFTANKQTLLGTVDRLPLVISLDNWHPALILQKDESTVVCFFSNGEFRKESFSLPRLAVNHSSAYTDINGDLRPDLLLVTEEEGEIFLEVRLSLSFGDFVKVQQVPLPSETGPLVFADFNRNGLMDAAFVSQENGAYFLTVLLNTGKPPGKFFKEESLSYAPFSLKDTDFFLKIRLDRLFSEMRPVLSLPSSHFVSSVPGGILVSDITLNGYPDIALVMIDNEGTHHVRILENCLHSGHSFKPLASQPPMLPGILSVSVNDHSSGLREALIVNNIQNGEYCLVLLPNPYARNSHRLSISVLQPDLPLRSYSSITPGIACRYYIEETGTIHSAQSSLQSSFLHLQRPLCLIGLGTTSYSGNLLCIGGPRTSAQNYYNKVITIKNTILPNSNLVAQPIKNHMKIELYLKLGNHVKNIVIVFIVVLLCNLILIVYSYFREKNRVKLLMKKEMKAFNFDAL